MSRYTITIMHVHANKPDDDHTKQHHDEIRATSLHQALIIAASELDANQWPTEPGDTLAAIVTHIEGPEERDAGPQLQIDLAPVSRERCLELAAAEHIAGNEHLVDYWREQADQHRTLAQGSGPTDTALLKRLHEQAEFLTRNTTPGSRGAKEGAALQARLAEPIERQKLIAEARARDGQGGRHTPPPPPPQTEPK